ncbi:uncharacterized protein LOC125426096 [Sphaerodactylus townsendi]|uniref:uncharacterized protein LOC125426096 n=1 Tax=Sphaerodactylus townsendi TaxID=933632 RepID=UPI002025C419|nr:uncharacterized protein LOC125426096 [Sphaerodactylus townsendi]
MTYAARADLQDQPLENPEVEFWTDGSSYMVEGKRFSGFAVVTQNSVIEARTLPPTYSAQAAELMAVMRALVLATGQRANIYTDSRYAFGVAHAFGELWKQRGLLTSKGSKIKHASLVLGLLEAIDGPSELAIVHCKEHAAGDSILARGNRRADTAAKAAAGGKQVYYTTKEAVAQALIERLQRPRKTFWEEMEEKDEEDLERAAWAQEVWEHEHAAITGALIPAVQDLDPIYTQKENKFAEGNGLHSREDGWWETEQGKIYVPEGLVFQILKNLHTGTHIGSASVSQLHRDLNEIRPEGLTAPLHPFVPGDWVYKATRRSLSFRCGRAPFKSSLPLKLRKPAHCETPPPASESEEDDTDAALTLPENEHI